MIDLHTHSTVSDGSDTPAAVVRLAAAAGLSAVALTDHDRLDGIAEARTEAEAVGIELVPGCEVSCTWPRAAAGTAPSAADDLDGGTSVSCHVLVYFVEPGEGPLQEELARLQDDRRWRNDLLVRRLVDLGIPITLDEVVEEAGAQGIGRPHFASVLVKKGVVATTQEAFDVWLGAGRPAYVKKARLAPQEVARLAAASGAVAVLAHPLRLDLTDAALEATVAELAAAGFGGLEATYGGYVPDDRRRLAALALRHGLAVTGGSDYHGTFKPGLSVGTGTGDLAVPDHALDELAAHRKV